jgi:Chaperone of endosialidase
MKYPNNTQRARLLNSAETPMRNKTVCRLLSILLTFLCYATSPLAQAVNPAPDGGYPGVNTAEGSDALQHLTIGVANAAIGWRSLFSNTEGSYNTALGAGTLLLNVGNQSTGEGTQNTAIGAAALLSNTSGFFNTAIGASALVGNTAGFDNTAIGLDALLSSTTGFDNTAIGAGAGQNQTNGSNNVYLGAGMVGVAGENNTIHIAHNLPNQQGQSACYIGGIYGQAIDPATATTVNIDSTGKLGTTTSSRRFKRDIQPMEDASEAILALKPVTFHYNNDAKNTPCFGLIAEDVAELDPSLVIRDQNGEPLSVRYDQINAMLLNEFLKEHRKVQEQEATIAELKSTFARQMEAVTARFKEYDTQVQDIRAQLELNKPTPQVIANNQ